MSGEVAEGGAEPLQSLAFELGVFIQAVQKQVRAVELLDEPQKSPEVGSDGRRRPQGGRVDVEDAPGELRLLVEKLPDPRTDNVPPVLLLHARDAEEESDGMLVPKVFNKSSYCRRLPASRRAFQVEHPPTALIAPHLETGMLPNPFTRPFEPFCSDTVKDVDRRPRVKPFIQLLAATNCGIALSERDPTLRQAQGG